MIIVAVRWHVRFGLSNRLLRDRPAQTELLTCSSPGGTPTRPRRFFEQAIGATKVTPVEVTTDHAPVYSAILEELPPAAGRRTDRYAGSTPPSAGDPAALRSVEFVT